MSLVYAGALQGGRVGVRRWCVPVPLRSTVPARRSRPSRPCSSRGQGRLCQGDTPTRARQRGHRDLGQPDRLARRCARLSLSCSPSCLDDADYLEVQTSTSSRPFPATRPSSSSRSRSRRRGCPRRSRTSRPRRRTRSSASSRTSAIWCSVRPLLLVSSSCTCTRLTLSSLCAQASSGCRPTTSSCRNSLEEGTASRSSGSGGCGRALLQLAHAHRMVVELES